MCPWYNILLRQIRIVDLIYKLDLDYLMEI